MNKLRKARVIFGGIILIVATLLFLDFTGLTHSYLGWVAKIQFIPALLATNVIIIVALTAATLIFGRLYCSVICPLGLFQDSISRLSGMVNKKRKFNYSAAKSILRWTVLAIFIVSFIAGISSMVALLEPYGAFGRMVSSLLSPLYDLCNNLLASYAAKANSYAFYSIEQVLMGSSIIAVAAATFGIVGYLAWRNGRTYCNTICPVGTILGFVSKFSLFKISIDKEKCNGCQQCARKCKSSCIDIKGDAIDYSRCVVCFDCIDSCKQGAISYTRRSKKSAATEQAPDKSKRNMLAVGTTLIASSALSAEEKLVDGGLALIEGRKLPTRESHIAPAGAKSLKNFAQKCVGCQLCVTVCPNNILRPTTTLSRFMQPEMSFELGFCRPECTKCSEVCPAGAIMPIDLAQKSSTKIGTAKLIRENCVVLTDGVDCGSCAAHCPSGAISMIEASDKAKYGDRKIPVVDPSRCIGCGACEYLCPARPFSAIYVEGDKVHKTI